MISVLSKCFKRRQPCIEKNLEEKYTQMISLLPTGMTFKQIRCKVKYAIRQCKEEAKREGADKLCDYYGEFLVRAAKEGNMEAKRIVDKARRDGATDDDIREFWNSGDLKRRLIRFYENYFLVIIARRLQKPRISENEKKEIELEVRKIFPVYGDPDDTSVSIGPNRPLPYELRTRVDKWRMRLIYEEGEKKLIERAYKYSTFNALARAEILKGNL